uniref:nuclease-related domain-containing protein n=1 Tax=Streptomyces sp. NRRL WC-3725 TaxID=1463933 RepID=UPI0005BC28A9
HAFAVAHRDGERRTAALLSPLRREGWAILHDRALPGTRANVDHLAIGPGGAVALVDSKRWSARWRLRVVNGRLLHGSHDVTDRLNGTRYETAAVAELLRTPVVPLVVVHGAPVDGGELVADGVRIVPADRAASVLRSLDRTGPSSSSTHLAARANRLLPPYRKGASR